MILMYNPDLKAIPSYSYNGLREVEMLKQIITMSRDILFGQIDHYKVEINNEADLQLHFSYILKRVGELFEFGIGHHLKINLETPFKTKSILSKSDSSRSKIDITLEWYGSTSKVTTCAIELKYFLKEGLREPKNRYAVFCDLKNLEEYVQNSRQYRMGYFLMGTDNPHYVNQKTYSQGTKDFDFRHNTIYKSGTELTYFSRNNTFKALSLIKDYHFLWKKVSNYFFLDHFLYRTYDKP
ncbi:hypothetical protein G9G63_25750 [Paenibacillus sp. EKM202P]|uniref:hypothetical protein n=1 Tax=Paenibacillus sp. EKM202P TaxID=1683670 RepID=UPI0013EB5C55|nr:hypothetical protein [Paenibacillus sp. EKM202P]KAF6558335.1 hypothetical protein G9G63_25750 [Paenibacillus sp. EKM202P]KAF6563269.1 hypothetical protein G9G64_25640 [Paenibacillus sp. EKM207P]